MRAISGESVESGKARIEDQSAEPSSWVRDDGDVDEQRATEPTRRDEQRRRALAKAAVVGIVSLHALLLVRGGDDPHKLFAFRPFNESDSWSADIVRVLRDGSSRAIDDGSWVYDWDRRKASAASRPKWTR